MLQKPKIYFDYAATTPMDPAVQKSIAPFFNKKFGNPSSLHWAGQEAQAAVIKARKQVADFLACLPQEIIFTSGATESDNLALRGLIQRCSDGLLPRSKAGSARRTPEQLVMPRDSSSSARPRTQNDNEVHIITTTIEHHAVIETAHQLEKQGVSITYLLVDRQGLIQLSDLKKAIRPGTILISVMYANNEIGTVQPIVEIGRGLQQINQERQKQKLPGVIFHTDAVQAINYLDCNVAKLGVDMLSLSGHKIYGPKGVGVLYVKKGTPLSRIQDGGAQEYGLRAGTLNVPGIVGFATAIKSIKYQVSSIKYIRELRDKLIDGVLKTIPGSQLNGSREKRLPNNANFSFRGVEGESLMIALDQEGIAVSTGSACASGSLEPSHVLLALGHSAELAHSSLRITLGKYTTLKEVDYFLKILPNVITRLRKISGRN